MASTPDSIAAVSQHLDEFFTQTRSDAADFGAEALLLRDAAAAACAGGKRLRARFCISGWRAVAEEAGLMRTGLPGAVIGVAAALEIFHAAALVHDDILDNSDTRRGHPSAHRRLEASHREQGWTGDAAAFGRAGATLLGDLLLADSDDALELALREVDQRTAARTRAQYARMRRDVTIGQFLDVTEESAFRTAPDDEHAGRALRVASLKSARYSVEQPLLIGGRLAGADEGQLASLSDFGHPIGMAFQLRDDVLGVFGDEELTGKPAGDDLREGKRTVLIAYTRQAVPAGARHLIDDLLGDRDLDAVQIASLQRTITDSGALQRVEELIADYAAAADRALQDARLGEKTREELRELARAATVRHA